MGLNAHCTTKCLKVGFRVRCSVLHVSGNLTKRRYCTPLYRREHDSSTDGGEVVSCTSTAAVAAAAAAAAAAVVWTICPCFPAVRYFLHIKTVLSTQRHPAHPVPVLIIHPREIRQVVLWSQDYIIETEETKTIAK